MKEAHRIYAELSELGVHLHAERGQLRISGEIVQISSAMLARIKRHRYRLVELLSATQEPARLVAAGASYRMALAAGETGARRSDPIGGDASDDDLQDFDTFGVTGADRQLTHASIN